MARSRLAPGPVHRHPVSLSPAFASAASPMICVGRTVVRTIGLWGEASRCIPGNRRISSGTSLENPPVLILSDMVRFRIRTNWTNSVSRTHEFELDDLADASTRDRLKWAFSDPDRLRPGETRQSLTERAAASFASVA